MIGDSSLEVSKLYGMLPASTEGIVRGRTAADNQTVRCVYVVGPDKKIKLMIVYPMTTGRNFDELLRVIDSLQLTANHKVATPRELGTWRRRHHRRLGVGRRGEEGVSERLARAAAVHALRCRSPTHDKPRERAAGGCDIPQPMSRYSRREFVALAAGATSAVATGAAAPFCSASRDRRRSHQRAGGRRPHQAKRWCRLESRNRSTPSKLATRRRWSPASSPRRLQPLASSSGR